MHNPFKDLPKVVGKLHSSPIMHRYEGNPLLTAADMPYKADLVFNAGVALYKDKYYIAPRVDVFAFDENGKMTLPMANIFTGFGVSDDGIHFNMSEEPIRVHYRDRILPWVCDARLTVMEGDLYLSFCFENQHSERPGIAKWRGTGTDFDAVCIGIPQQRNMVLWPEKVNGMYMRLERPSNQYKDPFSIWYGLSPDLRFWGDQELMLGCEDVPFANVKIGAAAPPIKTPRGWLLFFHSVDEGSEKGKVMQGGFNWTKRYTCGAALYDLDDPTKLIGITKEPLLVAEAPYETGDPRLWTEFTIFPCGAVLDRDGETIRVYYGAGDYCTCLATTTLTEMWTVITPCSRMASLATVPFRVEDWDGR